VFAEILPDGFESVEVKGDDPAAVLLEDEAAALGAVAPGRRRQFTLGRACARKALAALGLPPGPILVGSCREPLWPPAAVGSITHCPGYAAAAVARRVDAASVGIDVEVNQPLPEGVLDHVVRPDERVWMERAEAGGRGVCWDRLLFSAKESVYKAWFPLTHRWLGFEGAIVTLGPRPGTLEARLLTPGCRVADRAVSRVTGRYLVGDGFVFTAMTIPWAVQPGPPG
jgi:4'-phosphopantetheinyl transferase EntD